MGVGFTKMKSYIKQAEPILESGNAEIRTYSRKQASRPLNERTEDTEQTSVEKICNTPVGAGVVSEENNAIESKSVHQCLITKSTIEKDSVVHPLVGEKSSVRNLIPEQQYSLSKFPIKNISNMSPRVDGSNSACDQKSVKQGSITKPFIEKGSIAYSHGVEERNNNCGPQSMQISVTKSIKERGSKTHLEVDEKCNANKSKAVKQYTEIKSFLIEKATIANSNQYERSNVGDTKNEKQCSEINSTIEKAALMNLDVNKSSNASNSKALQKHILKPKSNATERATTVNPDVGEKSNQIVSQTVKQFSKTKLAVTQTTKEASSSVSRSHNSESREVERESDKLHKNICSVTETKETNSLQRANKDALAKVKVPDHREVARKSTLVKPGNERKGETLRERIMKGIFPIKINKKERTQYSNSITSSFKINEQRSKTEIRRVIMEAKNKQHPNRHDDISKSNINTENHKNISGDRESTTEKSRTQNHDGGSCGKDMKSNPNVGYCNLPEKDAGDVFHEQNATHRNPGRHESHILNAQSFTTPIASITHEKSKINKDAPKDIGKPISSKTLETSVQDVNSGCQSEAIDCLNNAKVPNNVGHSPIVSGKEGTRTIQKGLDDTPRSVDTKTVDISNNAIDSVCSTVNLLQHPEDIQITGLDPVNTKKKVTSEQIDHSITKTSSKTPILQEKRASSITEDDNLFTHKKIKYTENDATDLATRAYSVITADNVQRVKDWVSASTSFHHSRTNIPNTMDLSQPECVNATNEDIQIIEGLTIPRTTGNAVPEGQEFTTESSVPPLLGMTNACQNFPLFRYPAETKVHESCSAARENPNKTAVQNLDGNKMAPVSLSLRGNSSTSFTKYDAMGDALSSSVTSHPIESLHSNRYVIPGCNSNIDANVSRCAVNCLTSDNFQNIDTKEGAKCFPSKEIANTTFHDKWRFSGVSANRQEQYREHKNQFCNKRSEENSVARSKSQTDQTQIEGQSHSTAPSRENPSTSQHDNLSMNQIQQSPESNEINVPSKIEEYIQFVSERLLCTLQMLQKHTENFHRDSPGVIKEVNTELNVIVQRTFYETATKIRELKEFFKHDEFTLQILSCRMIMSVAGTVEREHIYDILHYFYKQAFQINRPTDQHSNTGVRTGRFQDTSTTESAISSNGNINCLSPESYSDSGVATSRETSSDTQTTWGRSHCNYDRSQQRANSSDVDYRNVVHQENEIFPSVSRELMTSASRKGRQGCINFVDTAHGCTAPQYSGIGDRQNVSNSLGFSERLVTSGPQCSPCDRSTPDGPVTRLRSTTHRSPVLTNISSRKGIKHGKVTQIELCPCKHTGTANHRSFGERPVDLSQNIGRPATFTQPAAFSSGFTQPPRSVGRRAYEFKGHNIININLYSQPSLPVTSPNAPTSPCNLPCTTAARQGGSCCGCPRCTQPMRPHHHEHETQGVVLPHCTVHGNQIPLRRTKRWDQRQQSVHARAPLAAHLQIEQLGSVGSNMSNQQSCTIGGPDMDQRQGMLPPRWASDRDFLVDSGQHSTDDWRLSNFQTRGRQLHDDRRFDKNYFQ